MSTEDIVKLISTVGFPIVAFFLCAWYIYKLQLMHKEESVMFAQAMNNSSTALNNNTLVLQKLCDKMDVEREGE